MKAITNLIAVLLVGACFAAPAYDDDEVLKITDDFYIKDFVKYESAHDIVKLVVPLNSLNFDESDSSESDSGSEDDTDIIIFFVEADDDEEGNRAYKGLYSLKKGIPKKILEDGTDAAASGDDSKLVFFGAKDGLYVYNVHNNAAVKYGSIDDSIIGIAKTKTGDLIYILTEDHSVYKVTENGTKKEKLDDIENAKQIVIDYDDNLFFFSDDKVPRVKSREGIKEIVGIPAKPTNVDLVKPPFILENGALFVSDDKVYVIYANGTSETAGFEFNSNAIPSAYAPEAGLIQYYAHNKKIYEYNILTLTLGSALETLNDYLSNKADNIRTLSTKSRINVRH